jgi:hypothetical protein
MPVPGLPELPTPELQTRMKAELTRIDVRHINPPPGAMVAINATRWAVHEAAIAYADLAREGIQAEAWTIDQAGEAIESAVRTLTLDYLGRGHLSQIREWLGQDPAWIEINAEIAALAPRHDDLQDLVERVKANYEIPDIIRETKIGKTAVYQFLKDPKSVKPLTATAIREGLRRLAAKIP